MESNTDCDRWFKIYFIFLKYIPDNGDTPINLSEAIFFFFFTPCIFLSLFCSLPHLISSSVRYQINPQFYILFFFLYFYFLHILMYIGRIFLADFSLEFKNFWFGDILSLFAVLITLTASADIYSMLLVLNLSSAGSLEWHG
jgi:fucose 4-O-acetylase-like acetyltransferase